MTGPVAALDCGTNSLRLLIATVEGPHLRDLVRRTQIVRLGQGVDASGALDPAALDRTRRVLVDYAALIEDNAIPIGAVKLSATSAIRDASNRSEFEALVRETIGIDPDIISGATEAGLSFTGATRELAHGTDGGPPPPFLVVDIGGGSTELIIGSHTAEHARSVNIGAVRLTERHLGTAPASPDAVGALIADVDAALDSVAEVVPLREARSVLCVAGTATTLAAIALQLNDYQPELIHHAFVSTDTVCEITERLLASSVEEIRAMPAVHPQRADVLTAGALILRTVLQRAGASGYRASEHDILDGIAWSVIDEQV